MFNTYPSSDHAPSEGACRGAPVALVAIVVMLAGGCGAAVKSAMLEAPNRGESFDGELNVLKPGPEIWGIDQHLYVPVGPPEAALRLWIKEPTDGPDDAEVRPRGTILVLHGWRAESFWMRHVGSALADGGFRAVHVDLRGHGDSTGDAISFGAFESRDLVQVLDALEAQGLLSGPVGVWGASMGAATAIQFAARDPRVDAVVSVAPYTSMREITPLVTRRLLPLMHFASDEDLDRLTDEAARDNQFDMEEADTLAAIRKLSVPVLIIHGKGDFIVPVEHGRALHEAAHGPCELIELDWTGHLTAQFSGDMTHHSLSFFDRTLGAAVAGD